MTTKSILIETEHQDFTIIAAEEPWRRVLTLAEWKEGMKFQIRRAAAVARIVSYAFPGYDGGESPIDDPGPDWFWSDTKLVLGPKVRPLFVCTDPGSVILRTVERNCEFIIKERPRKTSLPEVEFRITNAELLANTEIGILVQLIYAAYATEERRFFLSAADEESYRHLSDVCLDAFHGLGYWSPGYQDPDEPSGVYGEESASALAARLHRLDPESAVRIIDHLGPEVRALAPAEFEVHYARVSNLNLDFGELEDQQANENSAVSPCT